MELCAKARTAVQVEGPSHVVLMRHDSAPVPREGTGALWPVTQRAWSTNDATGRLGA